MGSREGPGVNHYMYFMQWSTCVAPNGTLHYGSLVLSYLSGYVLTTGRHAADGSVLPILEAMWAETAARLPAMRMALWTYCCA